MALLADRDATRILCRAARHEGSKALTQVRRVLQVKAGLGKYGMAMALVTKTDPSPNNMRLVISADGKETNLSIFGARQTASGISASPWGTQRTFRASFFYNSKVFHRTTASRLPIKPSYGPNIARELAKPYAVDVWKSSLKDINNRIQHEIEYFMLGRG
jgi:hypothetical protein